MNRIELKVADVHSAAVPSEAFSLILKEKEGNRYVPVVIGMSEARAILLEMHQSPINRPLTHELVGQLIDKFQCSLVQVDIIKYENGVYYADIQLQTSDGALFHLDARPSDAIALALRCYAPFFMNEDIFNANCMEDRKEDEPDDADDVLDFEAEDEDEASIDRPIEEMSNGELEWLLNQAVEEENYELAARIKEELEKR